MHLHRRIARIIAQDGITGLVRRGLERLRARPAPVSAESARRELEQLTRDFRTATAGLSDARLDRYLWYHTIDLPGGLVTPGRFDWRPHLDRFGFPDDLHGRSALDIGSATGFFSFELERRGAEVTSVELPSIAQWDMPRGDDRARTLADLMKDQQATSVEDLHDLHLEGPFRFCHERLGSRVRRCHSRVYDLSPELLGRASFDLVFLGDVLLHVFSPLAALDAAASMCGPGGTLIIVQKVPSMEERQPLLVYVGGDQRGGDNRTWFYPNHLAFEQMLRRLGFRTVEFRSELTVVTRPDGVASERSVIHARR